MKTRILTAVIAIPFALAAVFYLPNEAFALLMLVVMGIGAWEWGGFLRGGKSSRFFYLAVVLLSCVALWCVMEQPDILLATLLAAAAWWLAASIWVPLYPRGFGGGQPNRLMVGTTGLLVLVPAFVAMVALQGREANGAWQLMVVVTMIWAADTGAYFAGRFLGRHKLAPRVSPGKTWEGAVGGMLAGLLLALAGAQWVYQLEKEVLPAFMLMGAVVLALSIIGDLTESMFKRATDIKDSGSLFPGHGGIMDRIDSLTAAAPCFLLGLHYLSL